MGDDKIYRSSYKQRKPLLKLLTAEFAVSFTIVLRRRGKPRPSTRGASRTIRCGKPPIHMLWIASQLAHRLAHSNLLLQSSKLLRSCETSLNLASIYLDILKCFNKNLKIWVLGTRYPITSPQYPIPNP